MLACYGQSGLWSYYNNDLLLAISKEIYKVLNFYVEKKVWYTPVCLE